MILQALTRYYEALLKRGDIAPLGWSKTKISFALCLDKDGHVTQVIPTMEPVEMGKKTVLRPQEKNLPAGEDRSSNVAANFLWDNSGYILGIAQKGKPERSKKYFSEAKALHHAVLDGVNSPASSAILAFFDAWQPERAAEHPALASQLQAITSGGNLLFRVDGVYPQEDTAICDAWQRYWERTDKNAKLMQCLVTGQYHQEIARTHPKIKGDPRDGFQTMGNTLVSFNNDSESSYGQEQSYNAPVGKYAAFAYTAALNHLLANRNNVQIIGDTTVVCWAEGAEPVYQDLFMSFVSGSLPPAISDNDLRAALKRLAMGLPCDDLGVDPNRTFYVLGLAPNAARLSVRFFLRDSFGKLMQNVNAHYERLEIAGANNRTIPIWKLLDTTVRDPKKQVPAPNMAGATTRAIFEGTPYPTSLMAAVVLRIRAELKVTRERAAILKAYIQKNYISRAHDNDRKNKLAEVAQVQLNERCDYMPYVLGRLFRVMEEIQLASADWKLNRTIKDSYFNTAASTPKNAFCKLFPLSSYHLKKLMRDKPGLGKKLGDLESKLIAKLTSPIPARFTQEETNCFYIGYYHQENKEENKNV